MSFEHILHKNPRFRIAVDENSGVFSLTIHALPGLVQVYPVEYSPPYREGTFLHTGLSAMDLAILGVRALQVASEHTDEAEDEGIRHALLGALPGWAR